MQKKKKKSKLFQRAGPQEKHPAAGIPTGSHYWLFQHLSLISSSNHMVRREDATTQPDYLTHNYNTFKVSDRGFNARG